MKKLFLTLFFAAGIFMLWSHGEMLFGNRLFLDEPRVHKIEKGEYLSKLAKQYYGDPQRWRELALINRAPNPDHVEVGEEILVPAANAVTEISRARTLTKVNTLFGEQQTLATRQSSPAITQTDPATTTAPSSEITPGNGTTAPHQTVVENSAPAVTEPVSTKTEFPWPLAGAGAAVIVIATAGFVFYRRRQKAQAEAAQKSERHFENFRPRRHYGESAAKTESADQDDDVKDNDDREDLRRRHKESAPAAA